MGERLTPEQEAEARRELARNGWLERWEMDRLFTELAALRRERDAYQFALEEANAGAIERHNAGAAELAAVRAELAEAKRERDEANTASFAVMEAASSKCNALASRLASAAAEIERLVEALETVKQFGLMHSGEDWEAIDAAIASAAAWMGGEPNG